VNLRGSFATPVNLPVFLAIAAALLGCPGVALAHGVLEGVGSFYGGVLHPAAVPTHLVALVAAGLFVGQRGWQYTARMLPLFIAATAAGLLLATGQSEPAAQAVLLAGAAVIGILVAGNLRVPHAVGIALMLSVAFAIAIDSAPDSLAGGEKLAASVGSAIGINAAFIWISGPVTCLHKAWHRIGIRVAGSWTSASALLVLALLASGSPAAL
jgi:urease accessory protein